MNKFHIPQSS